MLHAVPRATNVPVEFGSPNEGFRVAGVGKTRFWEVCARAICFGALRYGAHTKLPKRPLTLDSQWKLQKLANPGINPVNSPYEACRSLQEYPALGRFSVHDQKASQKSEGRVSPSAQRHRLPVQQVTVAVGVVQKVPTCGCRFVC